MEFPEVPIIFFLGSRRNWLSCKPFKKEERAAFRWRISQEADFTLTTKV